jgi:hypothetical protein
MALMTASVKLGSKRWGAEPLCTCGAVCVFWEAIVKRIGSEQWWEGYSFNDEKVEDGKNWYLRVNAKVKKWRPEERRRPIRLIYYQRK